jgi:Bacterial archaeo-eukaryotic release factor family 2
MTTTTVKPLTLQGIREIVRPLAPATTVYLSPEPASPTLDAEEDLALRWRGVAARLVEAGAPTPTVDIVRTCVGILPIHAVEAAIIVAGTDVMLCQAIPGGPPVNRASYAAPAHVVPLLAWLALHPPHVEVVTDRTGADITRVAGGAMSGVTESVAGPDDEIERNAPGGWAQPRYHRRAEDSWRHNAGAVAEAAESAMREVGAELLLVAGDVRAVRLMRERLPGTTPRVVVRNLPGGRHPDGSSSARDAAIAHRLAAHADEENARALAAFDAGRGPRGRAVEGVANTLSALAAGRVRTLLVADDPGDHRVAWFGPRTLCLDESSLPGAGDGASLQTGRLVDIAVRAALLTDADVRVVDVADAADMAEGIGALCRFPI